MGIYQWDIDPGGFRDPLPLPESMIRLLLHHAANLREHPKATSACIWVDREPCNGERHVCLRVGFAGHAITPEEGSGLDRISSHVWGQTGMDPIAGVWRQTGVIGGDHAPSDVLLAWVMPDT